MAGHGVPARRSGRRTIAPILIAALAAICVVPAMPAPVAAAVATSRFVWSSHAEAGADADGTRTSDEAETSFVGLTPDPGLDPDTAEMAIMGFNQLWFLGPNGAPISAGTYLDATPWYAPTAGHPSMFIYGEGGVWSTTCAEFEGSFTVLEVAYTSGVVSKLAVDYRISCDAMTSYGSMRFNSSLPTVGVTTSPQGLADFGRPAVGEHADNVFTFTNSGETTVHVGTAALSGDSADDYSVPSDDCSGETLGSGEACAITLRFTASALGPATAFVHLPLDTPDGGRTISAFGLASTPSTITVDDPGTVYAPDQVTFVSRVTPAPTGWAPGAVFFDIDGMSFQYNGVDDDGNQTLSFSLAQVQLQPGTHTIRAAYTGSDSPDYLRPAESTPIEFTVGIGTTVTLVSGLNPSLSTEPVPLTAIVTSTNGDPIDGGTLTITDAFDGATLGTLAVEPGETTLSIHPILATGTHALTAHYSGHELFGPSDSATLSQVVSKDVEVDVANVSVTPKTFYPVVDGYRDTTLAHGRLDEPGSVGFKVISVETGKVVRTASLASIEGPYGWAWDGRNASGTLQPAGRYKVEQTIRDTGDNVLKSTEIVELSRKKLFWETATKTLTGGSYDKVLDPGNGWVRKSRSSYSGGVRIFSGGSAAGAGYSFTLVKAPVYGRITFKVLGRSPSGDKAKIAIWNPSIGGAQYVEAYDAVANAGPSYGWWSTSASLRSHRLGRAVNTLVAVLNNGAPVSFDIAKVRIVYRYAVLR